jgi:hypothetical protein
VVGLHGKTSIFTGFDEIHGYRNYDLFEALAPDPTRTNTLTWITSYDTIWSSAGIPLSDYKACGKAGTDPRMLFSWYSGDLCTDPAFADLEPELRANPSISSFKDGRGYLDQQRQRLPTHKFRRLHLNLPGAPEGAYFAQGAVMRAVVTGRRSLPFVEGTRYWGFIDMAGGGADDCVLAIGHTDADGRLVVDLVVRQSGERVNGTYNPLLAVAKFADIMREYHITRVVLDGYAGHTFQHLLAEKDFVAEVRSESKTEFYEALEVALNSGEVELLDDPTVTEQLLTLVLRAGGQKIDHLPNEHDDHANAVAGLVWLMRRDARLGQYEPPIVMPFVAGTPRYYPGSSEFTGSGVSSSAPAASYDYDKEQSWKQYVNADGSIRSTPRGGWGFP